VKLLYWVDVAFYLCFGAFVVFQYQQASRFYAGIGIAVVGFTLWVLARVQLGKSFAIRAEARALVTTGLYSKIRHPIYFFAGVAFLGLFVAWGKLFPLIGFLAVYSTQLVRILREEKVLEDAFGEEYRRYKRSTWF
jgi:protein-S-isoprenylcysteine O-methyltransferase Ste14